MFTFNNPVIDDYRNNLVSVYRFEDGGATISEIVESKNGTVVITVPGGLVYTGVSGHYNNCYLFNGGGIVRVPSWNGVLGTKGRTISCWIKPIYIPGNWIGSLVSWGDFEVSISTRLNIYSGLYYKEFSTDLTSTSWKHVCIVLQENAQLSTAKLFINGVADTMKTQNSGIVNTITSPYVRLCTSVAEAPGLNYIGRIDELYIWDTALSDAAAVALYTNNLIYSTDYTETLSSQFIGQNDGSVDGRQVAYNQPRFGQTISMDGDSNISLTSRLVTDSLIYGVP